MKIVTAQQMRELDRLTVERTGISWATLMETAGMRVAEAVLARPDCQTFAIVCGIGNNGGDGAVVARHLWLHGAPLVDVFLFGRLEETKGDTRANFEIIKRLAETHADARDNLLTFTEIVSDSEAEISIYHDCVIDALFGTGLTRPVEGLSAKAIEAINHERKVSPGTLVVSIDIPSGLSSDSAQPIGPYVAADLTVALTAPKTANVLPPASDANGELIVAPIGTPAELIEECDSQLFQVDQYDVSRWLRSSSRPPGAHKGLVGDVLIIAGSRGKTGAAALAAESVLRVGAGLVTVATSHAGQQLLVSQAPVEVMTEALEETHGGTIAEAALARAQELAASRTVVAIGPGLSSSEAGTRAFVRGLVLARRTLLVIDADGLNALSPWPEELLGSNDLPIVITPHPGEMARLTGKTTAEVMADRVSVARDFAVSRQVITVLKGQRSLVATPSGQVYVNRTGNAGMATAGAGDVLTGMISGFIAQQPLSPLEATIAAVYLHGLAGDLAAAQLGMRSLVASSIVEQLSAAILQVGGDDERG